MNILFQRRQKPFIIFSLLVFSGFLLLTLALGQSPKQDTLKKQLAKITEVYGIITENYVEEMPSEIIFKNALRGMLSRLDPHSKYFTPEEYREFQIDIKGELVGVGMEVSMEEGIFTVITPREDTPAFRAGILAGDRILEIDGVSIEGLSIDECVHRIRGKPGTEVTLTVLHKGDNEPVEITLSREIIKVASVEQAKIIDPEHNIGYLRVTAFQEGTTKDFTEAVQKLQETGLDALIVDLRFNGGGIMQEAVEMANRFIDQGTILSTRGRMGEDVFKAEPKKALFAELPLVILVNGRSASASEIFAGAIQDTTRGPLVGSATYGKGSVQRPFTLPDKSAVKLTIARYYTPKGICLQREKGKKDYGLEPDVKVEMTPRMEEDLLRAWREEKIIPPPGETPSETPPEKFKDIQLAKAIEILTEE